MRDIDYIIFHFDSLPVYASILISPFPPYIGVCTHARAFLILRKLDLYTFRWHAFCSLIMFIVYGLPAAHSDFVML